MSEQQTKEEPRPIGALNYARLIELVTYNSPERRVWEEREVRTFPNADPLAVQTVVGAMLDKAVSNNNPTRVAVYDRRPLPASLARRVFEIGVWACSGCGLEKEGQVHCQCRDKKAE